MAGTKADDNCELAPLEMVGGGMMSDVALPGSGLIVAFKPSESIIGMEDLVGNMTEDGGIPLPVDEPKLDDGGHIRTGRTFSRSSVNRNVHRSYD